MSKSKFLDLIIATIKGDDAEVTAIKIQKKAVGNIKAQLSAKATHTLTLEDELEEAQANLVSARSNNGKLIKDGKEYITSLLMARVTLKNVEEKIALHKEEIAFLEAELVRVQE